MKPALLLALLLAAGVACADEAKPNRVERAAKKTGNAVDKAAKRTGKAIDRAADKTEDWVKRKLD